MLLFPCCSQRWERTPGAKTCWAPEEGGRSCKRCTQRSQPLFPSLRGHGEFWQSRPTPWAAEGQNLAVHVKKRGPQAFHWHPGGPNSTLTAAGVGVQVQKDGAAGNSTSSPVTERRNWLLRAARPAHGPQRASRPSGTPKTVLEGRQGSPQDARGADNKSPGLMGLPPCGSPPQGG